MNWLKRSILTGAATLFLLPAVVFAGKLVKELSDPLSFYKYQTGYLLEDVAEFTESVKGIFAGGEASSEAHPEETGLSENDASETSAAVNEASAADSGESSVSQEAGPEESTANSKEPSGDSTATGTGASDDSAAVGSSPSGETASSGTNPSGEAAPSEASSKEESSSQESSTASVSKRPFTASLDDMLFIGDSRTVGLRDYGDLKEADFFASTGMSVYKIEGAKQKMDGLGEVSLASLLSSKHYGKIFIMLGINELGYDMDKTVSKFEILIADVKKAQPDAVIFLGANLHVTKAKSSHAYINNNNINKLNGRLKAFADNDTVYYLDANEIFDDSEGNLDPAKTVDQAHVLGRYYKDWGDWIREQIAELSKRAS